jgi:Domain found in Dishevelled, Egl-10, and Pleckstrin (DEP)
LLLRNPGFAAFWRVKVVYRSQPYEIAWANLAAMVDDVTKGDDSNGSSLSSVPATHSNDLATAESIGVLVHGSSTVSVSSGVLQKALTSPSEAIQRWLKDDASLWRYAVTRLLAKGDGGVAMRPHKRGLRVVHDSFLASELVDIIMEHANFSTRAEAVAIGQRLQNAKLITRVTRLLGRQADSSHSTFSDSDKLYVTNVSLHKADSDHACIVSGNGAPVLCWKEFGSGPERGPVRSVELKIPCDQIDLQSIDFWSKTVYVAKAVKGEPLGHIAVVHPLLPVDWMSNAVGDDGSDMSGPGNDSHWSVSESTQNGPPSPPADNDEDNRATSPPATDIASMNIAVVSEDASIGIQNVVSRAVVRKVFSSIARPFIMELHRLIENDDVDDEKTRCVVGSMILCKEGDNLGQDLSVETMFRIFNLIWAETPDLFADSSKAPFSVTYDVFPTSPKQGFMEALNGLVSFKDFDWDTWVATCGNDKELVAEMVASAAGSYTAAYILSIGDRHTENVQIQNNTTFV